MAVAVSCIAHRRNGTDSEKTISLPDRPGTGIRYGFGTVYKITYQSSENLKAEIEKELQKVDNSLSPFNKQSVITHINHNTDMRADSLFAYVFNLAKTISNETGKAYDVTVAPLVNAWSTHGDSGSNIPSFPIH